MYELRKNAFVLPLALAAVVLTVPAWISDPSDIRQIMLIAVFSLVVSGTNLSFGYAGEIQFAQVFMFAVGAYVSMGLATHGLTEVVPLLLLGALGAAAIAVVIALPAVRIGGWALAMTSFFLIIALPDVIRIFGKYTGGDVGLFAIPTPKLFGHELGATGVYELVVVTAVLWFVLFRNLVDSRYSVLFAVLRESPVLTASLGQSVLGLRLMAYGLSAIPAGMAGCLYGFVALVIGPSEFGLSLTIGILAASVIGGASSIYGAIIGAALLQLGPQTALSFANYEPIAFGAFLALAGIVFRHGLAGLANDLLRRFTARYEVRSARPDVSDQPAAATDVNPAAPAADPSAVLGDVEPRALRINGLTKAFGGVRALSDVSLQAQPGRITALIGANGSGKTTLLNLISGYVTPDGGTAELGDTVLSRLAPHRVARNGVARTFQTPKVPHGVPVLDVVASARYAANKVGVVPSVLRLPRYWSTRRNDRATASGVLALIGIEEYAQAEASTLSLGLRRLVEVARAVCSGSSLLLLDEPASGLNDSEVARLGAVLKILTGRGITVVLIEHNFAFVRDVGDYAYVLDVGGVIAAGTPAEIAVDPLVVSSYLGDEPAELDGTPAGQPVHSATTETIIEREPPANDAILAVRGLSAGYRDLRVLHGVDIDVHAGRIELLLGRNGVGKTTLLSAICGLARVNGGTISLSGHELRGRTVYRRAGHGLALVQEGKRVFHARTVLENVLIGTRSLKVSAAERRAICAEVIDRFPLLSQRLSTRAGTLSGGQQQMLAIAQALASRPKVLLLDEPSAGLSPVIVSELFTQVRLLADEGLAVLLVEQLAAKALTIADHVTLLDRGRVVATGAAELFRDGHQVHRAYFGTEAPIG